MHQQIVPKDAQHAFHFYSLRNKLTSVPRTRTNCGEFSLEYRVPTIYDILKTHINYNTLLSLSNLEVWYFLIREWPFLLPLLTVI